jgi:hypothetical protein
MRLSNRDFLRLDSVAMSFGRLGRDAGAAVPALFELAKGATEPPLSSPVPASTPSRLWTPLASSSIPEAVSGAANRPGTHTETGSAIPLEPCTKTGIPSSNVDLTQQKE